MNDQDLFDLIGPHHDVWEGHLRFDWNLNGPKKNRVWFVDGDRRVPVGVAIVMAEALFARSTGCGVFEGPNGVWFARHPATDAQADGPTRLHALVAAEAARRSKA